uniref:Uncharacterized protein n=1 Tax=Rhizophora mucronata TaxID=61149 RepID=A0A2P2JLK4_RHIMU
MAVSHENVEVWLPAEFLTEEELLHNKQNFCGNGLNTEFKPSLSFPTDFPCDFDSYVSTSALISPINSVVGSTWTDNSSDEDDFLTGLTRRLTQQLAVNPEQNKWVTVGSPESTPSGIGSLSASSNVSLNGGLSPPATHFEPKNKTWDLIYAAAGEVARLKMGSEVQRYGCQQGGGLLGSSGTQNPGTGSKIQNAGLFSSQSLGHRFSQSNQYQNQVNEDHVPRPQGAAIWGRPLPKAGWQSQNSYQQQKQLQIHGRQRSVAHENLKIARPVCFPQSAWPPLQAQSNQRQCQHHHPPPQHCSSGMRAVFLGGSGAKRECSGTGVFLPRRYGNPTDSKKKPACSTVLLPTKVVQALNLNLDDMNVRSDAQPRFNSGFCPDYDVLIARRNAVLAQQRRSLRTEGLLSNHDLRLPQEWTY